MYSSVITLANSIIGVSILAMPYCYKQCGVILATLMVLLSGTIVKVACHLLIKSAIMARRRNIENLAFHTHGPVGKLLVELGIIGYLIGTSIAFFVVMGDLGPPLIAKLAGIEETYNLRLIILTGLGLFVALPLSMLRNIESLQIICASSIMFYLTVVFRVVLEAAPVLSSGHWLEGVALWRPAGILQCFPIFSMALACQANIFEVYSCLPDPSPQKMNLVVKGAVNLCSGLYITIGFFGYLAFHAQDFGGNILTSFTPTTKFVDLLKLGFVISVAVSFPLVVFPCRTSIHSLIFRKTYQGIGSTELVTDYIPPARFNLITFGVIVLTLCIGIVVPDIELVLGIVGSTMGSGICVIFPAVAFLKLTSKNTTERLAAQGALIIGIITMILGTYVNLAEHTSAPVQEYQQRFEQPKPVYVPSQNGGVPPPLADPRVDEGENIIKNGEAVIDKIVDNQNNIQEKVENIDTKKKEEMKVSESVKNIAKSIEDEPENKRQEPAVPEEPEVIKKSEVDDKKSDNVNSSNSEVNKSTSSAKPTLDKDSDKEVDKEDAKNKKSTDEEKLDPEELLKEMKKYKQEQESVLQEQKKILSELKQHQLEDVAKKEQNQQQPAPALTNNSAAAGQLPPQSGGQLASGQLPGDPAPANQISGGQVVGANSPALQVQASYQGQQQQVVQSGQQAALSGQEQPIASPQQVQNQQGQPAQLQQQPILNQQIVGQQQPIQNQQFVPQQPVQNQQPMQQPFQNQQPVQNQQFQQPVQNQQPFQQPFQNQQPILQPVQNQMLPQASIQNQQPIQQPVQNQQPIQPPVQNQQQFLGQQPVQNQQLPQQPIQNPQYQGQQMQPVLNQGYASSGSYNAQLQANNQQQIVQQQPQLQNIQPQQQMNNNYNQMNVQQSNQQVQLQNVQPPPQQMLNNQPQPQQQLFNNQPQMAAYSVNGNNNFNSGNHEAGAEVPNAHLKMKNQAEVLGQANLLQSPGLGGKFDNNVKSGRDFKRDDHDMDRDSALCENDPNCAAKFDRNPLEDSPLSQDLLRLQYIGGKRNLQEERSISVNGNNSVKDEYL